MPLFGLIPPRETPGGYVGYNIRNAWVSNNDATFGRVVKEFTLNNVHAVHNPQTNTLVVAGAVNLFVKSYLIAYFVVAEAKLLREKEQSVIPREVNGPATESISRDRDVGAVVLWRRDPAGAIMRPENAWNLHKGPVNCSLDPLDYVLPFEIVLGVPEGWTPGSDQRVFVRATVQRPKLGSDGNYEVNMVIPVEGDVLPPYEG